MKKLIYLAGAALVMLASASCKKNSDVQNPESKEGMVKTVFSAVSNEGREKTSISGSDILWSTGDQVKIYAGTSTAGSDFTLTDGAGNTSAIFEGWISETATAPYYAVYPSAAAQGIYGSKITYSIPAEQAYVENSFATKTVPMVAYSAADKSLAFKNQTAFIKLQLTGAGTIATMKIASASNNICGTFSVSKTDPTATSTAVEGAKKITVTGISGTALDGTTPKNVIIALAPANFAADDLTLSMTASDGKVFSTTLGGFNVGRSQGKAVEVNVEFVAPPTTKGIARRTGDIDVEWVQLWAGGPKWAVYNVGASSVGDYGGYYCWGSAIDKDPSGAYYEGEEDIQGGDYDTAKNLWGDKWQMPTQEDFYYLVGDNAKTTFAWKDADTSEYGVAGLFCTGIEEGYTENTVFFPAAGNCFYGDIEGEGSDGWYYGSTPSGSDFAYGRHFNSDDQTEWNWYWRLTGCSVRAILAE